MKKIFLLIIPILILSVFVLAEDKTIDLAEFPYPFVKDTLLFVGEKAPASDSLAAVDVATMLQYESSSNAIDITTHIDSEFKEQDFQNYNIIAFGNPCDNKIIEKITPEYSCEKWHFNEGQAIMKLTNKFEKAAMIVSGTIELDTRRAAKVLQKYKDYSLKGQEVCVSGSSLQDINVKEGACTKIFSPVCGNGKCEPSERNTCEKDCPKEQENCQIGEKQYYNCPDGKKIVLCNCLNEVWDCIDSPEIYCTNKCGGCLKDKNCYPYGTRIKDEFCGLEGEFFVQLTENEICENDYECETNLCIDGKCISSGIWQNFLSWFKTLFS